MHRHCATEGRSSFRRRSGEPRVETSWFGDSPLEGAVCCELVSVKNSLLGGKVQGNSAIWGPAIDRWQGERTLNQAFTGQFPTHFNWELLMPLQGIK
jgi:hypothetical protein